MNTSRKPLVNATRALWKTQAKPKKVGELTPYSENRLGGLAKPALSEAEGAKPSGGLSLSV
jgi:hypothetical protein